MAILFNEVTKEFHLYNDHVSYIITILQNNQLGQLYYGKRIRHNDSFAHLLETSKRAMAACVYEGNPFFTLEHFKLEYPTYGTGDFKYPAYEIMQENGSHVTHFEYVSHKIYRGKPALIDCLPATYVEDEDEAKTLEITLKDEVINTELVLTYTIYETRPVITRNARFNHLGEEKITLTNAMSACVDLPDSNYEMIELTGSWSRERHVKSRRLEHGIQAIYSMRGTSSHQYNPFLALKRPNADEFSGEVYGFSFVYSGNFLAQAEVDTYGVTRITMGLHPNRFNWVLNQGEVFQTPEVVMVYSQDGLNGMSQTYHELYRTRLARGYWRDRVRPVLINNWEATYFDFNEDKILNIAKTAKDLGVELFVLDDGWFGNREDDHRGLGDWYVKNHEKLPNGIEGLAQKVVDLGIKFGLWFEPEMVNKDSDLYRAHPDWILATPNRGSCHGRNQYVLDFSRSEVVDYIFDLMDKVLEKTPISYIKWDMNRNITECFSATAKAEDQGKFMHKYILGVYDLYNRLTSKYPEILFESCASGGARFDPGMLFYAPQTWTSDDTDAIERLKIQYGTSMVYPICSMGSHVSAIPNHQTFRQVPLSTRANVAYFGTFGYELDLNKLTDVEKEQVAEQIEFFKEHRETMMHGTFYRLLSPFENDITSWMMVSPDQKTALVGYYRPLTTVNNSYLRVKLQGLNENFKYHVSINETTHYGDELMNLGLLTSDITRGEILEKYNGENGDYASRVYVLKAE